METRTTTSVRWFPAVLLGAVVVMFLFLSAGRISAPFGDSDEGINGAVWATNSRALREDGPIESRLGGIREDGTAYATHPPYIVLSTAFAETIAGERSWATRAPAWLGAVASIVLLYRLVRAVSGRPAASAAAVAATALSPMLFTYGFMLDTPVVSLPFGIGVLLAWQRRWAATDEGEAWPPVAAGVMCAVAATTGWQAAVLTGLAGATLLVRGVRSERHAASEALPFLLGGAIGIAASLSWTLWVYGDFATLGDKFFRRSGESTPIGVDDMVSFQIPWLVQLLGVGIVGFGACVAALWDRRFRPLAALGLGIVVVYALAFRQAAAGHQYWNYWALVPTAVGFAWAFDKLATDLPARARLPVLAAACAVVGVVNLAVLDDEALRYIDDGHDVAEQVVAADYPVEQGSAPYVGPPYRPDAWLRYYTRRSPVQLAERADLDSLAAEQPGSLTVVLGWCDEGDPDVAFCEEVVGRSATSHDGYRAPDPRVETARALAGAE